MSLSSPGIVLVGHRPRRTRLRGLCSRRLVEEDSLVQNVGMRNVGHHDGHAWRTKGMLAGPSVLEPLPVTQYLSLCQQVSKDSSFHLTQQHAFSQGLQISVFARRYTKFETYDCQMFQGDEPLYHELSRDPLVSE